MSPQAPQVALLDDGELADIRATLRELGITYCNARDARLGVRVPLLLTTPAAARRLAAGAVDAPLHQLHVAVCDGPGERGPCDLALRRPIEPSVLALLARQPSYGERRRVKRVSLGIPVKARLGDGDLREGVLTQVSIAGCGLECATPLHVGSRVQVEMPPDLTGPDPLVLVGRVLGVRRAKPAQSRSFEVSVAFDALDLEERVALRSLMTDRGLGLRPAAEGGGVRHISRLPFRRRVVGVRNGSAYLLQGVELSVEGLRVDPNARVAVGERLKVALYADTGAAPLLLDSEVRREAGIEGWLLAFGELEPARTEKLLCLLETLAPSDRGRDHSGGGGGERVARRVRC